MAKKGIYAMAKTGSVFSNGSCEYDIAFSVHNHLERALEGTSEDGLKSGHKINTTTGISDGSKRGFKNDLNVSSAGASQGTSALMLKGSRLNHIFLAVEEAVEEAIYNSLLRAETVCGYRGRCFEAISIDQVVDVCKEYNLLNLSGRIPVIGNSK